MIRVAILGDGLLGRSIERVLCEGRDYFKVLGHDDFEIMGAALTDHLDGFDVAINTIAYHRLAECEANPGHAIRVNAEGPSRVGKIIPQVYVSTDYVFNDKGPHDESLPGENPRSVYGQTKLAGEINTLERGGVVVRVAGLYHHSLTSRKGPTFPETILSSHDPIRLPTDQVFSPTYAPDAAERIVELALDLGGRRCEPSCDTPGCPCDHPRIGIYHAANDGSTSWAAFGQEIADLTRHDRHISGYEARDPLRPKNSSLISTRLPPLRHWRSALLDWETKR